MSTPATHLTTAIAQAMNLRPKVGGFPYLAESLRKSGITKNIWTLPACQALYITKDGPVVTQGTPLITGTADVPTFDREALIRAIRTDQAGTSTFPEFLQAAWKAGIIRYEVDFEKRTVIYYGMNEEYLERYPKC